MADFSEQFRKHYEGAGFQQKEVAQKLREEIDSLLPRYGLERAGGSRQTATNWAKATPATGLTPIQVHALVNVFARTAAPWSAAEILVSLGYPLDLKGLDDPRARDLVLRFLSFDSLPTTAKIIRRGLVLSAAGLDAELPLR